MMISQVVEQNTRAIEGLRADLNKEPPARKPWRIKLVRDRSKLIEYADLIPMEMKQWQ